MRLVVIGLFGWVMICGVRVLNLVGDVVFVNVIILVGLLKCCCNVVVSVVCVSKLFLVCRISLRYFWLS